MRSSSRLSVAVRTPLYALIALALSGPATALKAPPPQLSELEEADRKALETIAGHSESLRDAVLKASLHVDALVETQRIQEQSSASFQERIGKLDKKQQEQIWDIVREPGLLDELATEERPSRSQLDEIAKRHPEALAPAIRAVGAKQHDLLVDVAQIHDRANERFDAAIADLDDETQQAFRELVGQPELLSVLVRRVNLVVRLGDSYRKNPKDTRSYLSALAVDVEKRNAAAEKEWKERIEKDPKAAAELDDAARDYAEENGYDYDELTSPEARTRVTVVVNPYPYWFGYPVWYSDAYLYPYGWWYPYPPYFGYYRYHDAFVWWGLPSFTFVHWFYWGHHHHHFTHFHNCFHGFVADHRFAPTHRFVAANNFIARADPIDHHRGDWSWSRGSHPTGRAATAASVSGRDRGVFFNRGRGQDRFQQLDRRVAPGERGVAIDESRGRSGRSAGFGRGGREIQPQPGSPQRDAGVVPGDARSRGGRSEGAGRSRGHGRDTFQAREAPNSVIESPQMDRGPARGRGHERAARPSSRGDQPQFFQRSDPQPQREAPAAEPRSRGQREGRMHGGNVQVQRGVEVHRGGDPTPRVDAPRPSGGGGRGREFRGEAAPSPRGDGGHSHGHIAGGAGDSRGDRGGSWSGGGGDSRGHSSGWSGGGGGGGWNRGGGGGGGGRGGGGGGGGRGGDFGGGGRGDFGGGGGRGGR